MKNKPCKDCPFSKKSLRGWLADYTPESLHRIVMSEQHFPCHMQLQDGEDVLSFEEAELYPVCVGSQLYMRKCAKIPYNPILSQKLRNFTQEELDQVLSIGEFFKHHNIDFKD